MRVTGVMPQGPHDIDCIVTEIGSNFHTRNLVQTCLDFKLHK